MNYAGFRRSIGVALGVGWMTLCRGALAQSFGEECPLEHKGRACADDSTCIEATCSLTADGGVSTATTQAFCQKVGSVCSADQKYMDRCGANGRCMAQMTEWGEPGKLWCRSGYYVCTEFPASIDLDASPDVRRGQLRELCPNCFSGDPLPAVDAAATPAKSAETNAAPTSSSGNGASGCAVSPPRNAASSDPGHAILLLAGAVALTTSLRRRPVSRPR